MAANRVQVVSDNFNRAVLGTDWSQRNPTWGTVAISASTYIGTSSTDGAVGHEASAAWVGAGSINADCWASVIATTWSFGGTGSYLGVIARASTDTDSLRDYYGYFYLDDASGSPGFRTGNLFKVINGTFTSLSSSQKNISNGDRIEIECQGTAIRGLINAVTQHSATDSALSSGTIGVMCESANIQGDDFLGGNLVAFIPPVVVSRPFPFKPGSSKLAGLRGF